MPTVEALCCSSLIGRMGDRTRVDAEPNHKLTDLVNLTYPQNWWIYWLEITMTAPIARRPDGTLLPGSQLNAGGRPRGALDEFRAKFNPHMPEIAEVLLGLLRSQNESTRLSAAHEILNRLIGKPSIAIETTHTRIDVAQMYLAALKRANGVIDGDNTINGSNDEPGE